ncbi:hypothetical protein AMECASPLE_005471 [Ameca splendens]|uniref:Platelet-derived growth factor (PDGF) family profile domain-containing protein n=1 Tax=Ameca splendens TaxID=208324 RepID=A0ABV0YL86_9TELE
MQSLSYIMCLLLVLLLPVPVQMLNLQGNKSPKAMRFMEVQIKSMCRPIEQLVNVEGEFPDGVEHIYIPSCVPLFRCSGCCTDEAKECYPTNKRNITLEVNRSSLYVNLTFVEHQECGERLKEKYQNNTRRDRPPRRNRRKDKQKL